ncbi:MAG TPA: integrase arm-type DNA-binding domain-containing protein [Bdellovibrio sp.]
MALTDTLIKNTKASEKIQKLYDEKGLYLEVTPKGSKRWRFKYRFMGKEKLLSVGLYPEISLKVARERRDDLRRKVAEGIDPSAQRKALKDTHLEKSANTFEVVGREWHLKFSNTWVPSHADRILNRLERDLFPWLGNKPIANLTPLEVLSCLRRIENRGALETAHRALQNCSQIFRYAVATGRADRDVTVDLKGALPPVKEKHFSAITEPERVGELLRAIDDFKGTFVVQCALKLAPLVFVRPGELRTAKWEDVDLKNAEWRYHVSKTSSDHIVPLSKQAVGILREISPLTGDGTYVFPSSRGQNRPMSDNAILSALRRMEIPKEEMSGHGFRAMARTILDEVLGFPIHIIEHQLAHAVKDANGRAYNRTSHLPQRREMMQAWSDYLGQVKAGGVVISLNKKRAK